MSDIMAITYEDVVAVTPSDTTKDPKGPFCALEATTAGGVASIVTARGTTTTIVLAAGVIKTIACKQVRVTGTTATGIVGYLAGPPYAGGQQ